MRDWIWKSASYNLKRWTCNDRSLLWALIVFPEVVVWQVDGLDKAVDRLKSEKVSLECAMEMEEENIVNRMQRQLDHVLEKYQLLESCLEAKGINLKDIGAEPISIDQFRG